MARYAFILLLFTLTACGSGSNDDFSVSTKSLSFTATIDGGVPPSQKIKVEAKEWSVEEPDVYYSSNFIDRIDCEFPSGDTMVVIVTVKHPELVGIGTYSTNITIENSSHRKTISVSYSVTEPQPGKPLVNFVAPSPVIAGKPSQVIIRGSGFLRFKEGPSPAVRFGEVPGTNVSVTHDTEIRATAPALAAGRYTVNISGGSTAFTSTAEMRVIAPQTFATTRIPTSGQKSKIVFDAERKTIYFVNKTRGVVERYTHQSGTNWAFDSLALPEVQDVALSPDGKKLVAVDKLGFYEVDSSLTTLSAGTRIDAPVASSLGSYIDEIGQIGFINNAKAIAAGRTIRSGIYIYDPSDGNVAHLKFPNSTYTEQIPYVLYYPNLFAVPSGSAIYFGTSASPAYLYRYDATNEKLIETSVNSLTSKLSKFNDIATNSDESIVIINGGSYDTCQIYDNNLNLLGQLPKSFTRVAISPDGMMAFAYDGFDMLRKFNLSDPSSPAQIGIASLNLNGFGAHMSISPDGNTLFIVDTDQLQVMDLTTFTFQN